MIVADTRRLASARFEVVSNARARHLMRFALVAVLALLALVAGLRWLADGAAVAHERKRLEQENAGLRADAARLEAELELERATQAALGAQVGDLNRQVAELSGNSLS